jgi:uncharacterized protein (TIGR02452 family)
MQRRLVCLQDRRKRPRSVEIRTSEIHLLNHSMFHAPPIFAEDYPVHTGVCCLNWRLVYCVWLGVYVPLRGYLHPKNVGNAQAIAYVISAPPGVLSAPLYSSCAGCLSVIESHSSSIIIRIPSAFFFSMSDRREKLRKIAQTTLAAIDRGHYTHDGTRVDLWSPVVACKQGIEYYPPNEFAGWTTAVQSVDLVDTRTDALPDISVLEISTIDGIHLLSSPDPDAVPDASDEETRIGVLNFASATKPGGGFLNGAQAQEESLARSSTLYASLMTPRAQTFHTLHKRDKKGGYYTNAMVLSPGVLFVRDDDGAWTRSVAADVLTCAAVNAGVARKTFFGKVGGAAEEARIERAMRERMGRALAALERARTRSIVLGAFGTGVFQNDVAMVARVWADLLGVPGARFARSFGRVVFAIIGKTFLDFKAAFEARQAEATSQTAHSTPPR